MTEQTIAAVTLDRLPVEFPDYPIADLPAVPAHWSDTSWHNDTCPSFAINDSLSVHLDYADGALSEYPDGRADGTVKRFVLIPMTDGMVTDAPALAHSDDWSDVLAAAIGATFVANLRETLSDAVFSNMRRLNTTATYAEGCCASHNFCDANMPMADAFESIMGRGALDAPSDSPEHEADCVLWNAAWEFARANGLQAPAEPDPVDLPTLGFAVVAAGQRFALDRPSGASVCVTNRRGTDLPTEVDWAVTVWAAGEPDEADTDIQCDDEDAGTLADAVAVAMRRVAELEAAPVRLSMRQAMERAHRALVAIGETEAATMMQAVLDQQGTECFDPAASGLPELCSIAVYG